VANPVLKQGSSGEDVSRLQKAINDSGYQPPLVVDGKFGPKTALAVRWYQGQQGITVDGIVGSQTWDRIDGTSTVPDTTTGTTTGTTVKTSGAKDSYTGGDDRFHGLGGAPEVWYNSDDGSSYVVYFVPGFDPPIPMMWKINKPEDLAGFFGTGQEIIYDRVFTDSEMTSLGALEYDYDESQGIATEIDITEGDPFEGMTEIWAREAKTRPYLLDPEVAALIASSALEGRVPSKAELQDTWYYQHHSQEQIDWIVKEAADPIGAAAEKDANRRYVKQSMIAAGINNPDARVVEYLADNFTTRLWSETMLKDQINALADPYYDAAIDDGLQSLIDGTDGGIEIDRTSDKEEWVRETARKWLGPVYGVLSDQQVKDIAGRLRNDPNYQEEWVAGLKSQRVTLFPGYTDIDASYDEIAQPWRAVYFDIMGEEADETTTVFQNAIQQNDLYTAKKDIRMHGLTSGNAKVAGDFSTDAFRLFKGNTRGLIE
jgi:hypothetical protein